jgi:mannose-1-phosphate guanylyltransferase
MDRQLWAIVLAGGQGARLARLTQAIHGHHVAKQFARLCGDRSFLQITLDRIAALVPPSRTDVVVAESQMDMAREQVAGHGDVTLIAQPRDRGTAVGMLLPLIHVLTRDSEALVTLFPSDHFFAREAQFLEAVRRAASVADEAEGGIVLVGAPADEALTDLGWVVCGDNWSGGSGRARTVEEFVEKPAADQARQLLGRGALWNTLVVAARGPALWATAARCLPQITTAFAAYRVALALPSAPSLLRDIYDRLPSADLSRDILEKAEDLLVVPMIDAGWSDCGTPERLFRAFRGTTHLSELRARLAGQTQPNLGDLDGHQA